MSTKYTIASGDNFHFYHEAFDFDHVYLRLDTSHFEAGYGRVAVQIPIAIWETVRHLAGVKLSLVDKSDEDLLAMVERNVEQRLAKHQESLSNGPVRIKFVDLVEFAAYGGAGTSRESQVRCGMDYFQSERQRQKEVKARIAVLQKNNPPPDHSHRTG